MIDTMPHLLGAIGLVMQLAIWHLNKRPQMLTCAAVSFLFFAAQHFLLGATVGAIMALLAALRIFVALFTQRLSAMFFFIAVMIGFGIWQYEHPVDLFAIAGGVMGTILYFMRELKTIRMLGPVGGIFWGIHNFWVGAWMQFLTDVLNLGSQSLAIWRYHIRKN